MEQDGLVVTQVHVALAPAMEALKAGLDKAKDLGVRVGITILDANAHTVVAVRMDGSGARADEGGRGKATLAATLGVSTADFIENRLKHNEPLWRAMAARQDLFPVEGGFPLKVGDQTVGGVGVSGAKHEQDSQVSQAVAARFAELAGG